MRPQHQGVELLHILPAEATRSAYIERFNRTSPAEAQGRYVFTRLHEVRRMAADWSHRYNHQRPGRSLGGLSHVAYAMASSTISTFG